MTDAKWLAATAPEEMLKFLRGRSSDRKMRLFAVATCRRIEYMLPLLTSLFRIDDCVRAVYAAEQFADGSASSMELGRAWEDTDSLGDGCQPFHKIAAPSPSKMFDISSEVIEKIDEYGIDGRAYPIDLDMEARFDRCRSLRSQEESAQCDLLRDIFGNPFHPVTFSPSWRTSTAVALAAQMYESREFSAMPILADALQDAGCDNADVLNHCRGPGPHVRGCWVVDLVLGKE